MTTLAGVRHRSRRFEIGVLRKQKEQINTFAKATHARLLSDVEILQMRASGQSLETCASKQKEKSV